MLKSLALILCIAALLPVYAFFPEKALSQSVGVKECDFEGRETYTGKIRSKKIFQASLKPSSKGYALEIEEEDGRQVFGITKQLNYYYDSSGLYDLEYIRSAQISPDGSFLLILPHTPRRGCTFKGKLVFKDGAKEQLFPKATSLSADSCQASITKSKMRIESANVIIVNLDKRRHSYTSYPGSRYMSYNFWIKGPGFNGLMRSPALLKALSTDIIFNCKTVGIVTFGEYEDIATYGLMNNGTVQVFKCINPVRNRQNDDPWGYVSCV